MTRALLALALFACGHDAPVARPAAPADATPGGNSPAAVAAGTPAAAATATASPIDLTARTDAGVLTLTLRNTGTAPVEVATHVDAGGLPHLDWLTVELDDGRAPRTLHFVEARDRSALITATLAPGGTAVEAVDLVRWAIRGDGAAPLAPGTYAVRATWDSRRAGRGAAFVATATTTLTITAPASASCEAKGYRPPAGAHLTLLGHQAPGGRAMAYIGLYNDGPVPVCVYSHIATHETQFDWLTIQYADGAKYHHVSRVIALDDARDKSYPVSVLLAPGQAVWHTVDVDAWARRARNGSEPLPAGSLYTQASYDTSKETWVWAGALLSEAFELKVP